MPENVYQTAKVAKVLQLMEKGNAAEFKNKSLDEIDIDMSFADTDSENEGHQRKCYIKLIQ